MYCITSRQNYDSTLYILHSFIHKTAKMIKNGIHLRIHKYVGKYSKFEFQNENTYIILCILQIFLTKGSMKSQGLTTHHATRERSL